jgi:hypothetical protein
MSNFAFSAIINAILFALKVSRLWKFGKQVKVKHRWSALTIQDN